MSTPPISYGTPSGQYRPGVCNIGPAEIARRRRSGMVGIGAALALGVGLLLVGAPTASRWLVALPLAVGAVGLLQARLRFCAAYGATGIRNFGYLGQAERVDDPAARRADRARSAAIVVAAGVVGLAGALVLVLLPL